MPRREECEEMSDAYTKLRADSINTTQIDAMKMPINGITVAQIQARSFGMDEDEAQARGIFVIVKKERDNPRAGELYCLTFRDRDAAYDNCRRMNNSGGQWIFKVRETHFSGPYEG